MIMAWTKYFVDNLKAKSDANLTTLPCLVFSAFAHNLDPMQRKIFASQKFWRFIFFKSMCSVLPVPEKLRFVRVFCCLFIDDVIDVIFTQNNSTNSTNLCPNTLIITSESALQWKMSRGLLYGVLIYTGGLIGGYQCGLSTDIRSQRMVLGSSDNQKYGLNGVNQLNTSERSDTHGVLTNTSYYSPVNDPRCCVRRFHLTVTKKH